jgi:hypothetical protein
MLSNNSIVTDIVSGVSVMTGDCNNAPTTRARRKSANDSVLTLGPNVVVPTPNSARKPKDPSSIPLQQRQRIQRNIRPNATLPSKKTDHTMEELNDVVPPVVSRDDNDDDGNNNNINNTEIVLKESNLNGGNNSMVTHVDSGSIDTMKVSTASVTATTTTTTPTKCQPKNHAMPCIAENVGEIDLSVPVFAILPTMEDLHSKMHHLFLAATPSHNPYDDTIDWNELIFHRVRQSFSFYHSFISFVWCY